MRRFNRRLSPPVFSLMLPFVMADMAPFGCSSCNNGSGPTPDPVADVDSDTSDGGDTSDDDATPNDDAAGESAD